LDHGCAAAWDDRAGAADDYRVGAADHHAVRSTDHDVVMAANHHAVRGANHNVVVATNDHAVRPTDDDTVRPLIHHAVGDGRLDNCRPLDNGRGSLDNRGCGWDHGGLGLCDYRRSGRQAEQRFAMAEGIQIKTRQVGPVSLEDHQRTAVVPAPEFADLLTVGIDHAERVLLLVARRYVELDFEMEVLVGVRFCSRSFGRRPSPAQGRHLGQVPRGRVVGSHRGLLGQHDGDAQQEHSTDQEGQYASHASTPLAKRQENRRRRAGIAKSHPVLSVTNAH